LIELLLTVALLAIIVSIAIPRAGWSTMGVVQSKTAAREFANYLKLTKSLAITNASTNNQGYKITLSPASPYTSYSIIDADSMVTVKGPIDIPAGVICTGDAEFQFTPLGQLQLGSGSTLQFAKSTDTTTVSVTPIGRITLQ
jgi:type II secretory pathway pseudopilin PulG